MGSRRYAEDVTWLLDRLEAEAAEAERLRADLAGIRKGLAGGKRP